MANEAATTVVLRMRDEASAGMETFGRSTTEARLQSLELNSALTAMGSALTAVGSLLNQTDNQLAKNAATFITTAGAILSTAAAIGQTLPYIRQLITQLRTLAIAQAVVKALSGPVGLIGVGLAAGAAVGVGAALATRGGGGNVQTTVVNNNVQGSVITERRLGEITRQEIIKGQERNNTSGIR
jgi:hypothetical protein